MIKDQGPLIIVSGPSGSGKTTLVRRLLAEGDLRLRVAVTATTRAPRPGETNGVDYHFWTPEQFATALEKNEMLESARVHDQHYGTPRSEVEPHRARGWGVVLVIDVQGMRQVRQKCPDAATLFIEAPAWDVYERRLWARGAEDAAAIARRLATARHELQCAGEYDQRIINDDLEVAVAQVREWIAKQF